MESTYWTACGQARARLVKLAGGPHYSGMNIPSDRVPVLALCALGLIACSEGTDDNSPTELPVLTEPVQDEAGIRNQDLSGREAYDSVCAGCHETGEGGAPVTGNPADWENRSHLWQAVLMKHANAGYFQMPARGGREEWSEWTINAATQHMLEITFPDQLPD